MKNLYSIIFRSENLKNESLCLIFKKRYKDGQHVQSHCSAQQKERNPINQQTGKACQIHMSDSFNSHKNDK